MNPLILAFDLVVTLAAGAEETAAPEDYKAGWIGFAVIMALVVAVALLGVSLTRHLRKAKDNADHGAFGPDDNSRNAPS